ncbi:MAG: hypothetical protein JRF65_07075, partial [Deltaproteobacteria bacterium]|nr:hypothetical protein [Deltaproteobacteria bacterium]
MNRFGLTFVLVLIAFCAVLVLNDLAGAQQNEGPNVRFSWAFGALVGPANDKKLALITQDTILTTGDRLKLFVKLVNPCFVYLLHREGQGEFR